MVTTLLAHHVNANVALRKNCGSLSTSRRALTTTNTLHDVEALLMMRLDIVRRRCRSLKDVYLVVPFDSRSRPL